MTNKGMKKRYLDAMERALGAYTDEHIDSYFARVKEEGLTEHGFPRLTSNIGNMIAHGRRVDLYPRFVEMMSFCCDHVSTDRAANDFSIQEMIACIDEIESVGAVDAGIVDGWKNALRRPVIYNEVARSPEQIAYNWVLFSAVSEFMRMKRGLRDMDMDYIDMQITTQMRNLDKNLMYKDPNNPMVYDMVPRSLFSLLLLYGYEGRYRKDIDECLRRAGMLTLRMQSVTGEIPYGGRSNQFYHNEAHLAIISEYEARRYAAEGNMKLAFRFKRAACDALSAIEKGFAQTPVHHVKNRFALSTSYGCEDYAYFDKYMITAASFLNWARIICDESIDVADEPLTSPDAFALSSDFHKVFLRASDYFVEIDTSADVHYDADGIGRIHGRGAPGELALSTPGTSTPNYVIDVEYARDFAVAPGIMRDGCPLFALRGAAEYSIESLSSDNREAIANISCDFDGGEKVDAVCSVTDDGVRVKLSADAGVAIMLPAFFFNGEEYSEISVSERILEIAYKGYVCRYTVNGIIRDMNAVGCNRNGHYKLFYAEGENSLELEVKIFKQNQLD